MSWHSRQVCVKLVKRCFDDCHFKHLCLEQSNGLVLPGFRPRKPAQNHYNDWESGPKKPDPNIPKDLSVSLF